MLLVGAGVTTLVLVQQPLGRAPSSPPASAVVGTAETKFTTAGIEYATAKRFVSINVSESPVDASRIGLAENATASIPATQFGTTLRLIHSTDNTDLHELGPITVTSVGGQLATLQFSTETISVLDTRKRLTDDVAALGLDASEVAPLDRAIKSHLRAGEGYSATLSPADRFGFPITAAVACSADGACTISYTGDLT